jgi:hypothetical protein
VNLQHFHNEFATCAEETCRSLHDFIEKLNPLLSVMIANLSNKKYKYKTSSVEKT